MEDLELKGIDLKIDSSVQELCQACNSSANDARSILYFLSVVVILFFIIFLNSTINNWYEIRLAYTHNELLEAKEELKNNARPQDTFAIKERLELYKVMHDKYLERYLNSHQINLPIIGISIDILDVGLIAGVSFIILLSFLRFALGRTVENLQITFYSITNRYTDSSDKMEFQLILEDSRKKEAENLLGKYNYSRRLFHYNFLVMNEIFNLPLSDAHKNYLRTRLLAKILWLPFIIFSLHVVTDLIYLSDLLQLAQIRTILMFILCVIIFVVLGIQSKACSRKLAIIPSLYRDFFMDGCRKKKNNSVIS